ncbi:unnamed protein product, partial [Iphiclides podalirius]
MDKSRQHEIRISPWRKRSSSRHEQVYTRHYAVINKHSSVPKHPNRHFHQMAEDILRAARCLHRRVIMAAGRRTRFCEIGGLLQTDLALAANYKP